jgi:flagellar basal body-associated protein FliL
MTTSTNQRHDVDPTTSREHRRPWGWIAACVVLVLVAGGLAIWALGLQSDLDDQRDQTAAVQQQAEQQAQEANDQLDALSGQVDAIGQAVGDAGDELAQAGADAQQNAAQALDGLEAELAAVKDRLTQAVEKLRGSTTGDAP